MESEATFTIAVVVILVATISVVGISVTLKARGGGDDYGREFRASLRAILQRVGLTKQKTEEDYGDYGGKKHWKDFRAFLQSVLQRFGRMKQKSLEEKKILDKLRTLKELADCRADNEEIFKVLIVVLEEGVKLGLLYRDEVRLLKEEVRLLKEEVAKLKGTMWEEIDRRLKAKSDEFDQKLMKETKKFRKEREEEKQEFDGKLKKVSDRVGILVLQSRRRMRFIRYGEWNALFQRLVAWKLGMSWFSVAEALKAEGDNWEAAMHKDVKRILNESFSESFTLETPEDLWHLSAILQGERSLICHDSDVRTFRGAQLKTAIQTELEVLKGARGREPVPDFDQRFDGLMLDIFTVMDTNVSDIDAMKQAQDTMKRKPPRQTQT